MHAVKCLSIKYVKQTLNNYLTFTTTYIRGFLIFLEDLAGCLTWRDAVVVSMVVTTTLSTKSEIAVTMKTEATPREAKTMTIQRLRPLGWPPKYCQPCCGCGKKLFCETVRDCWCNHLPTRSSLPLLTCFRPDACFILSWQVVCIKKGHFKDSLHFKY